MAEFKKSVECVTMGHQGCMLVISNRDARWRVVRVEHQVFGKKYVEQR